MLLTTEHDAKDPMRCGVSNQWCKCGWVRHSVVQSVGWKVKLNITQQGHGGWKGAGGDSRSVSSGSHLRLAREDYGRFSIPELGNLDSPPWELRLASSPRESGLPSTGGLESGSSIIGTQQTPWRRHLSLLQRISTLRVSVNMFRSVLLFPQSIKCAYCAVYN